MDTTTDTDSTDLLAANEFSPETSLARALGSDDRLWNGVYTPFLANKRVKVDVNDIAKTVDESADSVEKLSALERESATIVYVDKVVGEIAIVLEDKADAVNVEVELAGKVDSSLYEVEMAGKANLHHPHLADDIEGLAGELERKANVKHLHGMADVDGLDEAIESVREFAENAAHGAGLPAGSSPNTLVCCDESGVAGWVSPAELAEKLPIMSADHPGVVKVGKGLAVNDKNELYYTGAGVDTPTINHSELEGRNDPNAHSSSSISHGEGSVSDALDIIASQIAAKAETETVNNALEGKANISHTHTADDMDDLTDLLGTKADKGALDEYALKAELTAGLKAKADATVVAAKANLDSPNFAGTPKAPTAEPTDSTTRIANTSWVAGKLKDYLLLSGGTMKGAINAINHGIIFPASHGKKIELYKGYYTFETSAGSVNLRSLRNSGNTYFMMYHDSDNGETTTRPFYIANNRLGLSNIYLGNGDAEGPSGNPTYFNVRKEINGKATQADIDASLNAKITYGTVDKTASTSALATGVVYLMYK